MADLDLNAVSREYMEAMRCECNEKPCDHAHVAIQEIPHLVSELTHTRQALESAGKEAGELRAALKEADGFMNHILHLQDSTKFDRKWFLRTGQAIHVALRPSSAREGKENSNG
jgi:hypothetical protein